MSTAARPQLAPATFQAAPWTPFTLVTVDILALGASFALGLTVRRLLAPWFVAAIGLQQYFAVGVAIFMLPLVHHQMGLYPGYLLGPVERLRRRILATLAVFGGLVAWDSIVERGKISRGVLLTTFVFALVLPPIVETLTRKILVRRGRWGIPVIMLGAGETGRLVVKTLVSEPNLGLVPVAVLENRPDAWHSSVEGVPVVGPLALAPDYEQSAGAALVAANDLTKEDFVTLLQELNFPRVIVIPDLAGMASLWVTARDLSGGVGAGCLGLELKQNLLVRRNHTLKRIMDEAIALPLFLAGLPIMALAALWIKIASRGPALYRQMREGFGGSRIPVWKLRTMALDGDRVLEQWLETHPEDKEHWGRHFKLRRDPRVLPGIGTLLRRTSLDELPQLWSILKGEMSLVGPRPLPDYHLEHFPPEFRSLRTRVLPGLTGLWQVSARSEADLKLQQALDTYYIRNWSPWLDLYILGRTVVAVLRARGAY